MITSEGWFSSSCVTMPACFTNSRSSRVVDSSSTKAAKPTFLPLPSHAVAASTSLVTRRRNSRLSDVETIQLAPRQPQAP